MDLTLFTGLLRFFAGLEPLLLEMQPLHARLLQAMAAGDVTELALANQLQLDLDKRIRSQLASRGELLVAARRNGRKATDLRDLLRQLEDSPDIPRDQWDRAAAWMRRLDAMHQQQRQASRINWYVAQRCCRNAAQTRDIIANGGRRSATDGLDRSSVRGGGTLLDAQV